MQSFQYLSGVNSENLKTLKGENYVQKIIPSSLHEFTISGVAIHL